VSFVIPLLLDGPFRKWFGVESLVRDRQTALDRDPIGALRDALLGALDGGELLAEVGREGNRNVLRVEGTTDVLVLSGLLALKRSIGADLADLHCQQSFNSRSLTRD
jgi:hypothetical protein